MYAYTIMILSLWVETLTIIASHWYALKFYSKYTHLQILPSQVGRVFLAPLSNMLPHTDL